MGDLVWVRMLFPNLYLQNFFPSKSVCTIFFFWNHLYPKPPPPPPPPPPPGILARGKLDTHYKIKETLLIRDLKPALSLSQNGWVTLGSPCPLNVGVQDWWRTVINNFDRDEGRRLICRPVKSDGLLVRWASIVFRERFYSSELSSLDITT